MQPPHRTSPNNDTAGTLALLPSGYPEFTGEQPCAHVDNKDAFFPSNHDNADETKKVCRFCPFIQPCGEYAVLHPKEKGVWGGMTERERTRIRRRRLAA